MLSGAACAPSCLLVGVWLPWFQAHGVYYCKNHFAQRFKESGNYDGSFIESNPALPAGVDTTTTKRFSAVATGNGDQISWGRYMGLHTLLFSLLVFHTFSFRGWSACCVWGEGLACPSLCGHMIMNRTCRIRLFYGCFWYSN